MIKASRVIQAKFKNDVVKLIAHDILQSDCVDDMVWEGFECETGIWLDATDNKKERSILKQLVMLEIYYKLKRQIQTNKLMGI